VGVGISDTDNMFFQVETLLWFFLILSSLCAPIKKKMVLKDQEKIEKPG